MPGHVKEGVIDQPLGPGLNAAEVKLHGQAGINRQVPQPLLRAVGIRIPVAVVLELSHLESLPRPSNRGLQFPGHRLHFAELTQASHVTDHVDSQPDRVPGQQPGPVRVNMLIPSATHVPWSQNHGGATADVHPDQLGRPLEIVLNPVLERPVMHVGVLVVGTEDRVVEFELVE